MESSGTGQFSSGRALGLVADGYERAVIGIKAEIRQQVEREYAEQWRRAGFFGRLILRRRISKEVGRLVMERAGRISRESLF